MPDASELLRLAVEKQVNVANAAEQKQISFGELPSQQTYLNAAIARQTGSGVLSSSGVERDLATLGFDDIQQKYGEDVGRELIAGVLRGGRDFNHLRDGGSRTTENVASDLVSGTGLAIANGLGGIGALGLGLFNNNAGVRATKLLNDFTEAVQGTQSITLQNRRQASALQNQLDSRDSEAQMESERAAGSSDLMTGLSRIGRDLIKSAANTFSDPVQFSDGLAQAFGSIVAAGPVSRGITALGQAPSALAPNLSARLAASRFMPGSTAFAIGSQEAGGAYTQTVTEAMDHLAQDDDLTNREKIDMASRAGLLAAGLTAPAAVLAGRLVERFEGAPFRAGSIRGAGKNIAKEGVEEFLQGGTGQLSQNVALQREVNPDLSLTDGVGEQLAQGAIFGAGAAGVTQSPSVAARASLAALRGTGRAVMAGAGLTGDALAKRAEQVQKQNEAASPVADAKVQAAAEAVVPQAPIAEQTIKEAINAAPDVSPEEKAKGNAYVDRLMASVKFNEADFQEAPESVQALLSGSRNRFEAMQRLAKEIANSKGMSSELIDNAITLHEMKENMTAAVLSDEDALKALPPNSEAQKLVEEYGVLITAMLSTPRIKGALGMAQKMINKAAIKVSQQPLDETTLNTPEGQANLDQTVKLMMLAPDKMNPVSADLILNMVQNGKLKLTELQYKGLMIAKAFLDAAKRTNETQDRLGKRAKIADVADQTLTNAERDAGEQNSATWHSNAIFQAMRADDTKLARGRMEAFRNFVQHEQNKINAINASISGDGRLKPSSFEAWNPREHVWFTRKAPEVHLGNENSVGLGQQMAMEARRLADIYNGMVQAFPELGLEPVQPAEMDPRLNAPAKDVVQAHRQSLRAPASTPASTGSQTANLSVTNKPTNQTSTHESNQGTKEETKPAKPRVSVRAEVREAKPAEVPVTEAEAPTPAKASEPSVNETKDEKAAEAQTLEPANPMVAAYPTLNKKNQFHNSYKLPETERSRLTGSEEPLIELGKAFAFLNGLARFMGFTPSRDISRKLSQAYREFLREGVRASRIMDARLQDFLGSNKIDLATTPATGWARGKVLNIVNEDGTYHEGLKQAAVLAGLQWLITSEQREATLDEEQAAKLLGVDPLELDGDTTVSEILSQGMPSFMAKKTLAAKILKYWGLSKNSGAVDGFVEGILEGVAAEVLDSFIEAGLLNEKKETIIGSFGFREINLYSSNVDADLSKVIAQFPSAIEEAVLVEPEDKNYFGDEEIPVPETQLRNPAVKLSAEQQEMIDHHQKTKYFLNVPMIQLYDALGLTGVQKLLGGEDTRNRLYNKIHLRSLNGKNLTIEGGFNQLWNLVAETQNVVEAKSKAEGKEIALDQMPIRFPFGIIRSGRLQMLGRYNVQSSKLMRVAVLSTQATLDLTKSEDSNKFMLALAQALGVKVHRKSLDASVQDVKKRLAGPLAESVKALQEMLAGEEKGPEIADILKDGFNRLGEAPSAAGLHALMEYARMLNQEDTSSFQTNLYVEADGVTNGPINAISLLSFGKFTPQWISRMRKGGLSFYGPKSMNDIHNTSSEKGGDPVDLYEATTDTLARIYLEFAAELSKEDLENFMALQDFMSIFLPNFEIQGDNLVMSRGLAKNPLTISIYGSGVLGLSGKIVQAMLDEMYSALSGAAQAMATNRNLSMAEALFGSEDPEEAAKLFDRFKKSYEKLTGNKLGRIDPVNFEVAPEAVKALRDHTYAHFAVPLREAISQTVGKDVMQASQYLQKAVMLQSILQKAEFTRLYNERLLRQVKASPELKELGLTGEQVDTLLSMDSLNKEQLTPLLKKAGLTFSQLAGVRRLRNQGLSKKSQAKIMKTVLEKYPLVDNGRQSFFMAGRQSTNLNSTEFGKSLTGRFESPGFVYGPGEAPKAGSPIMIIGNGDALMIQDASTGADPIQKTLPIFDGVHLSLDRLLEDSRRLNQAVYESWQLNPLISVGDAYAESVRNANLNLLSQEELQALMRAALNDRSFVFDGSPEDVAVVLQKLSRQIDQTALLAEARKKVMSKVQHSTDQMASAAAPYEHAGIAIKGATDEAVAQELNALLDEELKKIRLVDRGFRPARKAEPKPQPQPQLKAEKPAEVPPASQQVGIGVPHSSGVKLVMADQFDKLVASLKVPEMMKPLVNQIFSSGSVRDVTIAFGTAKELRAFAEQTGRPVEMFNDMKSRPGLRGTYHPGSRTIYMISPSSETMLHELIHAATFERVYQHYSGKVIPGLDQAIQALEKLYKQFTSSKFGASLEENSEALRTYTNVIRQLDNFQRLPEAQAKAAQLNEFMAWALSNKSLAEKLSETKAAGLKTFMRKALSTLKRIIFNVDLLPKAGEDMFSNLLFNTAVVINTPPSLLALSQDLSLYQDKSYGQSDRISKLEANFKKKIQIKLTENPDDRAALVRKDNAVLEAFKDSMELAEAMRASGFRLSNQEIVAFQHIVTAITAEASLDPNALAKAQELYTHVTKNLTVEDFLPEGIADEQVAFNVAEQQYSTIVGKGLLAHKAKNLSALLPVFLGLAMVSEDLRRVLAKKPLPKAMSQSSSTLDAVLENTGNRLLDKLSDRLAYGSKQPANVQEALDALASKMQEIAYDQKSFIDKTVGTAGGFIDAANDYITEGLTALSSKAVSLANKRADANPTKLNRFVKATTAVTAAVVNEKEADNVAEGVLGMVNRLKGFTPVRELLADIVGRTDLTGQVYDMIKAVHSSVQQRRQMFRENVPTIINEKFTQALTENEWSTLFRGLAKTDLAVLANAYNRKQLLNMLQDPKAVKSKISELEGQIQKLDPTNWSKLQKKSQQLARFMNTGIAGANLLRNAKAVAKLFNEQPKGKRPDVAELAPALDQLISLYALEGLSKSDRDTLASLAKNQKEGMDFTLAYLMGQRKDEIEKSQEGFAEFNHYKGHIPSLQKDGLSLIVADDDRFNELSQMSYVRVGDYVGSKADNFKKPRGYYFAKVSPRMAYNQGTMQNVHMTAYGVDPLTGFTEGLLGGRIQNPAVVERLNSRLFLEDPNSAETLRPVFNGDGNVVAFERGVSPAQLERLEHDTHLARMIGVWRGRQAEEAEAHEVNMQLIDALHQQYVDDLKKSSANKKQYVDLFAPDLEDAVLRDSIKLMPASSKSYITSKFEGEHFYVRRDQLNDVLGYRNASITDAWTGISRLSPKNQERIKNLAISIFGNEAYRLAANGEQIIQGYVKDMRTLIVVKSVIVPVTNMLSNLFQLVSRGVPLKSIIQGLPRKLGEVHLYTKSRMREIQAEAELRAATGNLNLERKLRAEIQSLQDSYRRLTIWPLIEAGEFTAISDAGISRDELLLSSGRLHAYIEQKLKKMPQPFETMGRYALVTKDTSLFQGLQKSVEYGDFLAKAILFDDLTKRKKMSQKDSLVRITEEFVNYDRLPGRTRGYLENMGLLWFWNFKIRSMKVALSILRNNPLHAAMATLVPVPSALGSLGTPLGDNLFSKFFEGGLGNSIGPGMAFHAPTLNPWLNLVR